MTMFVFGEAKPEGERGLDSFEWRKRMGGELEASSRRERSGSRLPKSRAKRGNQNGGSEWESNPPATGKPAARRF